MSDASLKTGNAPGHRPAWAYGHRGYALMLGLQQMSTAKFSTALTLLTLAITMALPAFFLFSTDDLQHLPVDSSRGQSVTAYLDPALSDLDGAELAQSIGARPTVEEVTYISQLEALDAFQRHSEFAEAIEVLEENPLPGSVVIYPAPGHQSQEAIEFLARQIQSVSGVERVQYDLQWVERLAALLALGKAVGALLAVLLVLTALVVIANTIRLEMLQRAKETRVTNLLGATRSFIYRPYLYLGALYGLAGGALALVLATAMQLAINPSIDRLATAYGSQFSLSMPSASHIALVLLTTIVLGLVGATLTLIRASRRKISLA